MVRSALVDRKKLTISLATGFTRSYLKLGPLRRTSPPMWISPPWRILFKIYYKR